MIKDKKLEGKDIRMEDYYGILKCPSCGEYAHFIIVEDFRNVYNLHQVNPASGIKELFLVCESCKMSFFYPPENRISDIRKLKRRGGFLDYATTKEVWNTFISMAAEFIEENAEIDVDKAVGFLMDCLGKIKRRFGVNYNYDRVYSAFFDWFCDQYGIVTDETQQQRPAAAPGDSACTRTLFA